MASVPVRDGNVHTIPYCGFLSWGKKFTNITQNEGQGLHWLCGIQCYHARLQNCLLDCFWESSETEATSTSLLYPSMLANISCYACAFQGQTRLPYYFNLVAILGKFSLVQSFQQSVYCITSTSTLSSCIILNTITMQHLTMTFK